MTVRKLFALSASSLIACTVALSSTPVADAATPASVIGLNASHQLAALNTAIKASPTFFPWRTTSCSLVVPMLASEPGQVMAGNFRDSDGNCYLWLNLRQSSLLTGSEICKLGLHEMGHLSGLQHSPDSADVMYSPFNSARTPRPCVAPTAAKARTHSRRTRTRTAATATVARSVAQLRCPPGAGNADYCESASITKAAAKRHHAARAHAVSAAWSARP
jgi:hypothetical protein